MVQGNGAGNPLDAPVIFVAEADPVLRELVVSACMERDLEVISVSHGIHAWKTLQKKKVDLVVAGWVLPEITGVGLLNLVRGHEGMCNLPMVLTSKQLRKEQVVEAGRAGVNDIMMLPMDKAELGRKILEILGGDENQERLEAKALYKKGLSLMEQERYQEALESFQAILDVFPAAEVYYNLGYIKTSQEQYPEAIAYFRKATEINSAHALSYRMMGKCFERMGQIQEARRSFQRAATIFMERDLDESAEETLNELLRVQPDTINVYNSLGIIYRRRGDYPMAAEQYRKALKISPKDENIHYNLARMYYESGEMFLAQEILEEALEINPEFGHALDLLRVVVRKLDGREED